VVTKKILAVVWLIIVFISLHTLAYFFRSLWLEIAIIIDIWAFVVITALAIITLVLKL
jgi:hypothetical protein